MKRVRHKTYIAMIAFVSAFALVGCKDESRADDVSSMVATTQAKVDVVEASQQVTDGVETDTTTETAIETEPVTEPVAETAAEIAQEPETTPEPVQSSAPWYYAPIFVRTYAAREKGDQVQAIISSLGGTQVSGQEMASGEDTAAIIAITERFADLTENTFARKYEEVADWCYLSIGECWSVIDQWNKQSELVAYKIEGVYYSSPTTCRVDVIEFVNDNFNVGSGVYDGTFGRTGEWRGHLHFELRAGGWFLASENYDQLEF